MSATRLRSLAPDLLGALRLIPSATIQYNPIQSNPILQYKPIQYHIMQYDTIRRGTMRYDTTQPGTFAVAVCVRAMGSRVCGSLVMMMMMTMMTVDACCCLKSPYQELPGAASLRHCCLCRICSHWLFSWQERHCCIIITLLPASGVRSASARSRSRTSHWLNKGSVAASAIPEVSALGPSAQGRPLALGRHPLRGALEPRASR